MADNFKAIIEVAYQLDQANKKLQSDIKKTQEQYKIKFKAEIDDKTATASIKNIQNYQDNFNKKNLSAIDMEIKKKQESASIFSKHIQSQMQERINAENKIQSEQQKTEKLKQNAINFESNKIQLDNNISTYLKENTKLSTGLKNRLVEIQSKIKDADAVGLKNLKQEFRESASEAKKLGKTGDSVFTKLGKNVGQFLNFLTSATLVMGGIRAIKGMITEVKNLDSAYVDLQQATGKTRKEVGALIETYFELGQELGATATDVAKSAADWLRQGKSIADTNKLIRDSMILSKIGQIDSANSTTYLTTAMKGYGVAVDDVLGIVDKLSAVDMASATSVAGLAEGMSEVATNANLAGISMDKLLGYLAVIGETTGEGMSSVGNSLSTMFSRMGNIKLARLKDYQNNGEDLSNVETVLRGLNIELRDSNKEFRNFGSVLDETAGRWSSFDGVTQRAIASSIAGKDHMEDFLVLMTNYGTATKYAEVSINSVGTAMEKFSAYSDSVEAKTERLSNSFQKLSSNTINSSWVKGFLDLSNVLVNVVDKIGLFNIALLVTAGILGSKGILMIPTLATSIGGLISPLLGASAAAGTLAGTIGAISSVVLPLAAVLWAITLAVKAYDHFNVTLEENQEALAQLKGEYDSITSEVKSLEAQIASVQSKMKEMEKLNPVEFVNDDEYQKLSDSNDQLDRRLTIQRELQKIAAKDAEEKAIETIGQKSENSIINVKTIHSDYSGTSVKAEKITRDAAITERIDEYKKLTSQIEELENKQYDLAKANNTESKEYKNIAKELNNVNEKRDEHYQYILKTMETLESESVSIVGATKDSEKYTSVISILGNVFDDFIASITKSDSALSSLEDVSNETKDAVDDTVESMYSLAKAAEEATGFVNDLGENVDISKLQDSVENALSSIKDFNSILESMDTNKGITSDDLDTITQKYPQLLSYIGDEKELRKQLTKSIEEQKESAKGYYKDILELDTNLYNNIISNNATKVNKLNEYYGTDLSNYKSLAKAKNEVETTLLTSLNEKWAKYYSAQSAASEIASRAQSSPLNSGIWGAAGGRDLNNAAVKLAEEQAKILKDKAINEQFMYNQMKNLFVDTDYTGLTVDNILLGSDKSSTKDTKDKFSQVFDWLSIRIDKLKEKAQSAIDSIAKYTSYKNKNSKIDIAVNAKVDHVKSLKDIQDSYNKLAENVKLPQKYMDLVDNGGMNIQTITDEKLSKQIDEYTKLRDAANTVGKSISDINDEIKELNSQKLDNIKSYFDMKNSYSNSKISKRESLISLKEAQGGTASKSDYNYLIKLQNDIIANNKKEREAYELLFNKQVKDGIIKKGSVEYYEGLSYLNDLTISAREAQSSLIDLSNEKIKLTFKPFDTKMEKSNKVISEVDQAVGFVDDNSIEQIALFQTGYAQATQNVKDLNAEIKKLNKQYVGKTDDPIYKERLADLESQLSSNASAMQSYDQSIISSMKARYDKQISLSDKALKEELKNIEKAKKAQLDALKKQLDEFKKYIDARKKELRDDQETDEFDESVAQYNKDISKLESRIVQLKKAELQGDNVARQERSAAEDELDIKKKDLAKLQKDRSIDLAEDALDKEYDAYEEMKNKQMSDTEAFYDLQTTQAQSLYDNKVLQLESLYENERQFIIEAAQLTQDKFSQAFASINSTMKNYGSGVSSGLSTALGNGNNYANSTAKSSSLSSILGTQSEANKYTQNTSGMSGLNEYLASKGYKMITTKQMVELAKSLGLGDIDSTSLVGTDDIGRVNKDRILKALQGAKFANTGKVATATKTSPFMRALGEDVVIGARGGEVVLDDKDSKTFENFVPTMNNFMAQFKPNIPDLTNLINAKNSAPNININLPANTIISKDAMSDYRKFIPEITEEISKNLIMGSKR